MNHQIKLFGEALPESEFGTSYFWFDSLSGQEKINELFEYHLIIKVRDEFHNPAHGYQGLEGYVPVQRTKGKGTPASDLNLQKLIGTELAVRIRLDGLKLEYHQLGQVNDINGEHNYQSGFNGARFYRGLVNRVEVLPVRNRHATYKITLVPWLWLLTKNSNYRIFQKKTVLQIIEDVLQPYTYPVDWRCSGDYETLDYQAQYGESDYTYVCRMLFEHGINFHFEHSQSHLTLVLSDHNAAYKEMEAKGYSNLTIYPPNQRFPENAEYIEFFEPAQQLVSGKVQLSDYQFKQPGLIQNAQEQFLWQHQYAEQEIYEWHQGDFDSADKGGTDKAKHKVEELYQHGYRAQGSGHLKGLQTGFRFNLANHPNSDSNRGWLVLGTQTTIQDISEEKSDNQFYDSKVDFIVQPDEQILRPDKTIAKPHGRPQTAIVVGPPGEEIHTDKYGRVKVRFHWDRTRGQQQDNDSNYDLESGDGSNTCWLRVSTAWAGNNFGTIHLPRIGQEVIVDFFNGDPDMPFVSGRLTNPEQMPLWELPSQKALSGIKSKELGGSQANQLVMDDTMGQVQVHLKSDHQSSELNLGYIRRIPDRTGRADYRGEGFELRTDGHGVIRSNKGLFFTAYGRADAAKTVLEMEETIKQLEDALKVAKNLNATAKKSKHIETRIANEEKQTQQLNQLKKAGILQSSPDGIASTTAANQIIHAGQNTHIISEVDTNISSNSNITLHAGDSVGLFANSNGAKIFANQGPVEIQAQHDELLMNALKNVEVTSTEGKVSIFAKEELLISCGGAYIKFAGGQIELGSAQPIKVKAGLNVEASNTIDIQMPSWPKTLLDKSLKIKTTQSPHSDDPYVGMPFTLYADGAEVKNGITDETGFIRVEHKEETKEYKLVYASGDEITMNMVEEFEEKGSLSELSNRGFHPIEYDGMDISADEWAEQYSKFVDSNDNEKGE